jgi:hypothetical protein
MSLTTIEDIESPIRRKFYIKYLVNLFKEIELFISSKKKKKISGGMYAAK